MNTKERYGVLLSLPEIDGFLMEVSGSLMVGNSALGNKGVGVVELNVNGVPYAGKSIVARQLVEFMSGDSPHPLVKKIGNHLKETGRELVIIHDEFDEYLRSVEEHEGVKWGNAATGHQSSDWALARTSEVMVYADRGYIRPQQTPTQQVFHVRAAPVITYPYRDLGGRAQLNSVKYSCRREDKSFVVVVIASPAVEKRAEKFRGAVAKAIADNDLLRFNRQLKSLRIDLGGETDEQDLTRLQEGMATVGAANMVKERMMSIVNEWVYSCQRRFPMRSHLFSENLRYYCIDFCKRYFEPYGASCLVAMNDVRTGYLRDVIRLGDRPKDFGLPVEDIVDEFFREHPRKLTKAA